MYKAIFSGDIELFDKTPYDVVKLIMSFNEKPKEFYKEQFDEVIKDLISLRFYCAICGPYCDSIDHINDGDATDFFSCSESNFFIDLDLDLGLDFSFNFVEFRKIYLPNDKRIRENKKKEEEHYKNEIARAFRDINAYMNSSDSDETESEDEDIIIPKSTKQITIYVSDDSEY